MIPLLQILLPALLSAPQATAQDLDAILAKADRLLDEAKEGYEDARARGAVDKFVEAGFKLEEARIKYLVLQEIGAGERAKLASERLRAVQQLSKLINDGRIAIAKPPAGDVPPPSAPASPAPGAPAPSPPPASAPAGDVVRRLRIPADAALKEAGKLIQDLFKDQFAKKGPADRQALSRQLLEQAAKTTGDPAGSYVLYREAADAAVQAGDVGLAMFAVEETSRLFDVDGLALRAGTLAALGKSAKNPAELAALAEALLRITEEYIAADLYDAAEKAAGSALQHARKAGNAAMAQRATGRAKEIAEAKSKFAGLKNHLETLARDSEHPGANLEMGQFLCFVKGSWDLGLRFLSKGSDPVLKALAEKELALPADPAAQAALADGWWELAQKEKAPLRKAQMALHAIREYQAASFGATGLLKAKVEKRLSEYEKSLPPPPPVDLLALVDPAQDRVTGTWAMTPRGLANAEVVNHAVLQLPYAPPAEYDLTVVVERLAGDGFIVGLSQQGNQFFMLLDGWNFTVSGLSLVDGKWPVEHEFSAKGPMLRKSGPSTVVCVVRREGVKVVVDGKTVGDWKGMYSRLSNEPSFATPQREALFLVCPKSKVAVSKISLQAVSGEGRRLR